MSDHIEIVAAILAAGLMHTKSDGYMMKERDSWVAEYRAMLQALRPKEESPQQLRDLPLR